MISKNYWLYIIQSEKDRGYYVGITNNRKKRVKQPNASKTKSTKGGRPWKLIYSEKFKTLEESASREKEIKSWKNTERFLKSIGEFTPQ